MYTENFIEPGQSQRSTGKQMSKLSIKKLNITYIKYFIELIQLQQTPESEGQNRTDIQTSGQIGPCP